MMQLSERPMMDRLGIEGVQASGGTSSCFSTERRDRKIFASLTHNTHAVVYDITVIAAINVRRPQRVSRRTAQLARRGGARGGRGEVESPHL